MHRGLHHSDDLRVNFSAIVKAIGVNFFTAPNMSGPRFSQNHRSGVGIRKIPQEILVLINWGTGAAQDVVNSIFYMSMIPAIEQEYQKNYCDFGHI